MGHAHYDICFSILVLPVTFKSQGTPLNASNRQNVPYPATHVSQPSSHHLSLSPPQVKNQFGGNRARPNTPGTKPGFHLFLKLAGIRPVGRFYKIRGQGGAQVRHRLIESKVDAAVFTGEQKPLLLAQNRPRIFVALNEAAARLTVRKIDTKNYQSYRVLIHPAVGWRLETWEIFVPV